jgi:Ca-activated chloride channel homolog
MPSWPDGIEGMAWDRPGFLLLLPIALLLIFLAERRSLVTWTRRQAIFCRILRVAVVALIVLALAGPRSVHTSDKVAVIFLRDVSDSISLPVSREENRSAEILFAREPVVLQPFGQPPLDPAPARPAADASDLSSALEFAAALLPPDQAGRIVLLSDGVVTAGRDPLVSAASLAERGVEIDTIPLPSSTLPETAVTSLQAPTHVREGEVFDLTATLHASAAVEEATLRLYQNQILVAERQVPLTQGTTEVMFPRIPATGRTALYEVEVSSESDTHGENNRRRMVLAHGGPAKVLIIDNAPEQSDPLADALRATGIEAEIRPAAGLPSNLEGLEAFNLIIFSEAPAADFSNAQMTLLTDWVRDFGGGFLMLGGGDSFGAGGYFRTPIAPLLPVQMERQEREETPVVALLVVLDRSGSMSATVGGQTKMSLANEGAALALDVLQSKDQFGLFAVDTQVQDVIPLGRITDKAAATRRIAGITSGGGGIYIYTSLAEAFPRLREARARIKHIILFSDATDAEEKTPSDSTRKGTSPSSLDLAGAMLANHITLSVVALGNAQDRDTAFLRQLAAQGGGRFYLTPDATALPRLFTLETLRAMESSLREEPLAALPHGDHQALTGIDWKTAPKLLGANITKPKPGAEVLLTANNGDPLLTEWRFGLGQVAAFTSDAKARWAAEWLAWPGYGKFWAQTARTLIRNDNPQELTLTLREENDHLIIEAGAVTPDGTFRNGLDVTVSVAPQGASPRTLAASQVAPGWYRASLPLPETKSAMIAVGEAGARPVSGTWTRNYPAEYQISEANTSLLENLSAVTSGQNQPDDIFRPAVRPARTRQDLSPILLALAVILWPLDIWLRRRDWKLG